MYFVVLLLKKSTKPRKIELYLEQWYSMKRLLPHAHQVTPNATIYDPLLGNIGELSVHSEHTYPGRDDNTQLPSAVETSIQIVLLEYWTFETDVKIKAGVHKVSLNLV
jgi:hypothetical protein